MQKPTLPSSEVLPEAATRFSAAVARLDALDHAIRTPLGTLASGLELVKLSNDPAVLQSATMMDRQVRQMMTQVEELRDIAKVLHALL